MDGFLDELTGQLIGLATFFAFPILQYVYLKFVTRKEGQPQLWYLPEYGFRLVIRNLPRENVLSDIKYRVFLRRIVPSSSGSSVKTYQDDSLLTQEELFLFPGNDQVLVSFQLKSNNPKELNFILTDKLGKEHKRVPIAEFDCLICDYVATVENLFNFDVKIAKRAEIKSSSLRSVWEKTKNENTESCFSIDRIRDVG
jgi:hypothetical protein